VIHLEEVGHENLVFFVMVRCSQYVGTLQSLREVAKDVIDEKDALCRGGGTSDIFQRHSVTAEGFRDAVFRTCFQAIDSDVFALGFLPLVSSVLKIHDGFIHNPRPRWVG